MIRVFTIFCLLIYATSIFGSVNVTNYGAVGDLQTLVNINVVSNSTALVCPGASFSAVDIGKLIEVVGGGIFQTVSNDTLYAYITGISTPTNITVSVATGTTATNLVGLYGTDDQPAFSNAITACSYPTDTIVIPQGNYFCVPRDFLLGFSGNWPVCFPLNRGGLTLQGQGSATLTSAGGWRNFSGAAYRGTLFTILASITNNVPLVFTNLTLDGGVPVGNIHNQGNPADPATGLGWDSSHHWMLTEGNGSGGGYLNRIVMVGCTVQHWRGEMMEATESSPNLYLCATNCQFMDGDGSCINNFAHACVSCTFSNANQAEEFYRAYATNVSYMIGCSVLGMNGAVSALNGGTATNQWYFIETNLLSIGNGQGILTCPAANVLIQGNTFTGSNGSSIGIFIGSSGGQGFFYNSNLLIIGNTFTNVSGPLFFGGSGINSAINVFVSNNVAYNDAYFASAYAGSQNTNVVIYGNTGSYIYNPETSGQWLIDAGGNNWVGLDSYGGVLHYGAISGQSSSKWTARANGANYFLDDTNASLTVPGSQQSVASTVTGMLNTAANGYGTSIPLISGTIANFTWTGAAWVTNLVANTLIPNIIITNINNSKIINSTFEN